VTFKSKIAGQLLATGLVAALAYIVVSVNNRVTAQQARIEKQIFLAERQIDRLEAVLRRLEGITSLSSITQGARGRAQTTHHSLAEQSQQLHQPSAPDADMRVPVHPESESWKVAQHRQGTDSVVPQRRLALVAAFEKESSLSEWGKAMAMRIERAYETEPFFARFDGALKANCRTTTCVVTWTVPVVDSKDPELAMAEYELMALAAQKEQPVRRMQSVRHTEKGRTIIQFYVAR